MFPHGRSFSPEAFEQLQAELNYWMLGEFRVTGWVLKDV